MLGTRDQQQLQKTFFTFAQMLRCSDAPKNSISPTTATRQHKPTSIARAKTTNKLMGGVYVRHTCTRSHTHTHTHRHTVDTHAIFVRGSASNRTLPVTKVRCVVKSTSYCTYECELLVCLFACVRPLCSLIQMPSPAAPVCMHDLAHSPTGCTSHWRAFAHTTYLHATHVCGFEVEHY